MINNMKEIDDFKTKEDKEKSRKELHYNDATEFISKDQWNQISIGQQKKMLELSETSSFENISVAKCIFAIKKLGYKIDILSSYIGVYRLYLRSSDDEWNDSVDWSASIENPILINAIWELMLLMFFRIEQHN